MENPVTPQPIDPAILLQAQKAKESAQAAILAEAQAKIQSYPNDWKAIYDRCRGHEAFAILGKQMDAGQLQEMGLPSTTKLPNLLKKYVNQQANTTLESKFKATVTPNGGGSDITKARARADVLRGIQNPTCGPVFNAARRGQLAAGIHYSRVVVDYASDRGFEKSMRYEDVENTYNVFSDPFVSTPTFSDARDFLIKEDIPKAIWKERTGTDWGSTADKKRSVWYYWRKKTASTAKEYLMKDGTEVMEGDLPMTDGQPDMSNVSMMEDNTPFARDVSMFEWEWFMIPEGAGSIYRQGKWMGTQPPLVACTGERVLEHTGSGIQVYYVPLTADAEEPQLMYSMLEIIIKLRLARSPFSKWKIAYETVISKQSKEYRDSSVTGKFDVLYRSVSEDGKHVLPPPEEIEPHILDRLLIELQEVQRAKIENILGIPSAVFGEKTNEKSGVAIKERRKEGNVSSYHYTFNFIEYVKQMGIVTLDAFPHYYTVPQQVKFMDEEDKAVMTLVNTPDGISFDPDERYELAVEVVPDSETNREAEADKLLEMIQIPLVAERMAKTPGVVPIIVKAMPGRYAQQIAAIMEDNAQDPEKEEMRGEIQRLQGENQKLVMQGIDKRQQNEIKAEEVKIKEFSAGAKAETDAFNAETDRLEAVTPKVDIIEEGV